MKRWLISVVALCGLTACGSSPKTHFYTLDPIPAKSLVASRVEAPLQVGQVILPGQLDRAAFVRRIGPNRVDVSAQDRWSAPLDQMIQSVLSADLEMRLPRGTVISPGAPASNENTRRIQLAVNRFIGDSSGEVVLDAEWSVFQLGPSDQLTVRPQQTITCKAASALTGDLVAAMSRCLAKLSDRIAATETG